MKNRIKTHILWVVYWWYQNNTQLCINTVSVCVCGGGTLAHTDNNNVCTYIIHMMICVVYICYSQLKAKSQPNLWSWIIMCCFGRFWSWQRGNTPSERRLLALHIQEQGKLTLLILPTHDPLGLDTGRHVLQHSSACVY